MCLAFLPSRNYTYNFLKTLKERIKPIIGGASSVQQTKSLFRDRFVGIVTRNIKRAGSITGDIVERCVVQARHIMRRNVLRVLL